LKTQNDTTRHAARRILSRQINFNSTNISSEIKLMRIQTNRPEDDNRT